jgi:hypothetical protein
LFSLLAKAKEIPSMTDIETRELLRQYAADVPVGTAIVEVGAWLGSCTAFLAMGVMDSGRQNPIHVYDRFEANPSEIEKALKWGIILYDGERTTGCFDNYVEPFRSKVKIIKHVGNIKKAKWYAPRISLYVDDASKRAEYFVHSMRTFARKFIKNKTYLFLLDFFYYEKKGDLYQAQEKWMEKHKSNFKFLFRIGPVGAVFKYLGGYKDELSKIRRKRSKSGVRRNNHKRATRKTRIRII